MAAIDGVATLGASRDATGERNERFEMYGVPLWHGYAVHRATHERFPSRRPS